MLETYDPKKVTITFVHPTLGSFIATGFAKGTFLKINRDDDSWKKYVGPDGRTARAKTNNLGGMINFTCTQTSQTNNYLDQCARLDEILNQGVFAVEVRDALGSFVAASTAAWVRKRPDADFQEEIQGREWPIDCADLLRTDGGTTPTN